MEKMAAEVKQLQNARSKMISDEQHAKQQIERLVSTGQSQITTLRAATHALKRTQAKIQQELLATRKRLDAEQVQAEVKREAARTKLAEYQCQIRCDLKRK